MIYPEIPSEIFDAVAHSWEGIVLDPVGLPNKVVRQQALSNTERRFGISALNLIELTEEHLAKLDEEEGIAIPPFTAYVGIPNYTDNLSPGMRADIGGSTSLRKPGDPLLPALYTVVEAVEGTNLNELIKMNDPKIAEHSDMRQEALFNYADWVVKTNQPFYLYDIAPDRQYTLGHLAIAGDDSPDQLFMHDLDPYMARNKGRETILATFTTAETQ